MVSALKDSSKFKRSNNINIGNNTLKTCLKRALSLFIEKMIMEFTKNLQVKTYLLYGSITTDQLFPQVSNVVVIFLHVLLEIVPPEC